MRRDTSEPRSSRPALGQADVAGEVPQDLGPAHLRPDQPLAREHRPEGGQRDHVVLGRHADDGHGPRGAGHVERLHDQFRPPDHLEREVGAPALGQRPHPLDRVARRPGRGRGWRRRAGSPPGGRRRGRWRRSSPRPAMRAPWTTDWPTPPQPITATLDPGCTPAVLRTAPSPVVTPQPSRASCSSARSVATATIDASSTTIASANVPQPHTAVAVRPSGRAKRLAASTAGPSSQWFDRPLHAPPARPARRRHRRQHPVADRGPPDVGADGLDDPAPLVARARSAAAGWTAPGSRSGRCGRSRWRPAARARHGARSPASPGPRPPAERRRRRRRRPSRPATGGDGGDDEVSEHSLTVVRRVLAALSAIAVRIRCQNGRPVAKGVITRSLRRR